MTVRELYSIFSANGFPFEFKIYGNDRELQGTHGVYADAKVLFVRDYAVKCEPLGYENGYVMPNRYVLVLSIEIEV